MGLADDIRPPRESFGSREELWLSHVVALALTEPQFPLKMAHARFPPKLWH